MLKLAFYSYSKRHKSFIIKMKPPNYKRNEKIQGSRVLEPHGFTWIDKNMQWSLISLNK